MDVVDPATVKKMRSVSRPSTLKDVHADLCKHMDFTEIPRLASWALVEQMHPAWIQTPAQHVSMYLASAASIWLTRLRIVNQQNAIVSLSGTFTLSRIIIGMQSARVPEFTYTRSHLACRTSTTQTAFSSGSQKSEIWPCVQDTPRSCCLASTQSWEPPRHNSCSCGCCITNTM